MKNILLEEIEKYKRLSNYNPKMTLTENIEIISEQRTLGTTVREVESALGKNIQAIMKDFKIAGMDAATITKLLEKDARSFEKEWAKALQGDLKAGFPKGELGPLGKELSKIELFRRISNEVKNKGKALTKAEMDALMAEARAASKLKAAKFVGTATKDGKTAAGTIKSTADDVKVAEGLVTKNPGLKKWDWKKLSGWGAKAGIAVGALYLIYKMTHTDEPLAVTDTTTSDSTTTTTTGGGTGSTTTTTGGGTGSKYKVCPDTFPIKQFCKNETIRKVQGCIGVTPDSKFGPITQGALEAKGVSGTEITQATIDKVCNTQTAVVDTDSENVDADNPNDV